LALANSAFTSVSDFDVDLYTGELRFSANGGKWVYEKSLTRPYKSIEEEMIVDSKKPVRRTSNRAICKELGCLRPRLGNRAKVAWGGWFRENPEFCERHQPGFVE
jgi:hypothetical protein